jgi:AraC family transcriptional regulator, exoenzyme S synthesis regulatory protein ExsA
MVLSHQKFDFNDKCLIEKVVIQAPFRFAANFRDEACFIYFAEGRTTINSASEQTAVIQRESVLLKCGSYFADLLRYSDADRFEILVFHLYPDILRTIYKNEIPAFLKPSSRGTFIQKVAADVVVQKFIESLYFYFDHPSLVSNDLLELKIKELILLLVQSKNAASVVSLFAELFTPRSLNVKEIVNGHLFSDLTIGDLASLTNLSLSTFNRTFKAMFGDTPANYIRIKRLERAQELLSMSSLTVSEIAYQTCFPSLAHFSRCFKAHYQCSPREYRLSLGPNASK